MEIRVCSYQELCFPGPHVSNSAARESFTLETAVGNKGGHCQGEGERFASKPLTSIITANSCWSCYGSYLFLGCCAETHGLPAFLSWKLKTNSPLQSSCCRPRKWICSYSWSRLLHKCRLFPKVKVCCNSFYLLLCFWSTVRGAAWFVLFLPAVQLLTNHVREGGALTLRYMVSKFPNKMEITVLISMSDSVLYIIMSFI